MSHFSGKLTVTLVGKNGGRSLWALNAPFSFRSDKYGVTIDVPEGFIFDFASVPFATKNIVDDDDPRIVEASAIHDYLCDRLGDLPTGEHLSSKDAAAVLVEAMEVRGAPKWMRTIVYAAVVIGGPHWD